MAEIFENSRLKHYAGISEDDSIGPEGSYLYGENIEAKRFFKYVELAKKPISLLNSTDTGGSNMNIGGSTPNETGGENIFFLGNNGKIFNSNGINVYNDSTGNNLDYHSFSVADTYYYTSNTGSSSDPLRLNKIAHSNMDQVSWSVSEDILNGDTLELLDTTGVVNFRTLVIGNIAYISNGKKIAKFNHNTQLVEAHFDLFPSEIIGMNYTGGNINVFLADGLVYIWDGVNETQPLEIITLNEKLDNLMTFGNRDYLIGGLGNLVKFMYLEGYTPNEINSKQYSKILGTFKFNITKTSNFQYIAKSDNEVFVIDQESNQDRIASYGNVINGIPPGYTINLTRASNGNLIDRITFLFVTDGKLFFGYSNGASDKGVEYIDLTQTRGPYVSSGSITELLFDGGDVIKVKKEEKLLGKCELPAGTSLDVYQSVNGSNFELCKTITGSDLNNGLFSLSDHSFYKTNYREVTYTVNLNTTDENVTPRWYGFKTLYSFTD